MKKFTIFVSAIFVFYFFINQANAEITSKKLLLDVFDGCVNSEEVDKDLANNNISAGNLISYCGCTVKEISKSMTTKELASLGIEVMKSKTKEQEDEIFYANKKLTSAVTECLEEMYD